MSNRVSFVTGGAQGIGRGICEALAAAGFRVAVADLNLQAAHETAAEIVGSGGDAIAVQVDVTSSDSVASAVGEVTAGLGPIEVVVNNAGWDDSVSYTHLDVYKRQDDGGLQGDRPRGARHRGRTRQRRAL